MTCAPCMTTAAQTSRRLQVLRGERGVESDALTGTQAYVYCVLSVRHHRSTSLSPILVRGILRRRRLAIRVLFATTCARPLTTAARPSSCVSADPQLLSPAMDSAPFATTCAPCTTTAVQAPPLSPPPFWVWPSSQRAPFCAGDVDRLPSSDSSSVKARQAIIERLTN